MLTRRDFVALGAAAVATRTGAREQPDVIVIGAGLAGLNAAMLLEAGGARVTVIEGERRIGGRLHTLDDLPGRPDAGGIQVGSGYTRLRAIAARLGVGLKPGGLELAKALYRVNGVTVGHADWAQSGANRLGGPERALLPAALGPFYGAKLPRLATPADWRDPANIAALDVPWDAKLREFGASDEARRLIQANFNGNAIGTMSALHLARSSAILRAGAGPGFLIAGGSQRLPEAMARTLAVPVRMAARVAAIGEDARGVDVTLASGKRLRADHIICTIPFAALGAVRLHGTEPMAVAPVGMTRASFAFLQADRPFWRDDGAPETLWTDEAALGRVFVLGDDPAMLKLWLTGASADAMDRLGDAAAEARIIGALAAARPASRGRVRLLRRWSWQQLAGARGIYHHIRPGEAAALSRAIGTTGRRLHFAGEHLAVSASGMEGALESGERAARAILSA